MSGFAANPFGLNTTSHISVSDAACNVFRTGQARIGEPVRRLLARPIAYLMQYIQSGRQYCVKMPLLPARKDAVKLHLCM